MNESVGNVLSLGKGNAPNSKSFQTDKALNYNCKRRIVTLFRVGELKLPFQFQKENSVIEEKKNGIIKKSILALANLVGEHIFIKIGKSVHTLWDIQIQIIRLL